MTTFSIVILIILIGLLLLVVFAPPPLNQKALNVTFLLLFILMLFKDKFT